MIIESKRIEDKGIIWILRCPTKSDATELSKLRVNTVIMGRFLDK